MTYYFATFPKDTGFPFLVAACIWPHLVILCHYSLSHTGLLFKDTFQWMVSWSIHLHLITLIRSKCCPHQGHFSESMGRAHLQITTGLQKASEIVFFFFFFVSKPDLDGLWESLFWHEETCRRGGNVIFPQRGSTGVSSAQVGSAQGRGRFCSKDKGMSRGFFQHLWIQLLSLNSCLYL